jgi:colanic acid/amylovoran biosynthesis protein
MSGERKKFVLADSFSYLNKGDAGIILGMLADVRQQFNDPSFTLISETPDIDRERYGEVGTMGSPFRRVYRTGPLLKKLILFGFTFVILLWGGLYRLSGDRLPCPGPFEIVQVYGDADAVLVAGGDKYYNYRDGFRFAIEKLPKLFETILSIMVGTKLMIYAHSAGPFNNRYNRYLLRYTFRQADVITAREPVSHEHFASLDPKVELTADAAFLAPDGSESAARTELNENDIDPKKPVAGLTARNWHFPEGDGEMSQYRDGMEQAVTSLREQGYQVVFFPQVIGPYMDDRVVSREIACNIDGVLVLEDDYDVPLLREMIGLCDVFVGTRMHSNIFALSKRVPTVAIAYRHKTNGIMHMLGLEEYVVNIPSVSKELPRVVAKLLEKHEQVEEQLGHRLPEMTTQANRNGALTEQMIRGVH